MRVLKAIRLSRLTDETTSPERQDQAIMAEALRRGMTVVDEVAEDLDVSASKLSPFERSGLGKWLTEEKAQEYDAIMWWRLDRAVRSMNDLHKLVAWAERNKKMLVFVTGPGSDFDLDMTRKKLSPVTQMLMTVVAFAAQVESEAISERVADAQRHLRKNGLWGGGLVPYGLRPQGERGAWRLVRDPKTYLILRELIDRVLAGEAQTAICKDFNARGLLTTKDHQDEISKEHPDTRRRRDPKGRRWHHTATAKILRSKVLLGETTFGGQVVRDELGKPVLRAEPAVTEDEWGRLQAMLDGRSLNRTRTQTPSMLLNVAHCAACGLPLYRVEYKNGRTDRYYPYYICRGRDKSLGDCVQKTSRADQVDAVVSRLVLMEIGTEEIHERRFVPGEDRAEQLAQVDRLIDELKEEQDAGLVRDRAEYLTRLRRLMERRKELAARPSRSAGVEWVPTGITYGEAWPTLENAAKRKYLMDLGVRVYVGRGDNLPAAEKAYKDQGSPTEMPGGGEFGSAVWSEDDVAQVLGEIGEFGRTAGFRFWLHQEGELRDRLTKVKKRDEDQLHR